MAKVTFEDKVALNENADIPNINKCMASDLNELKTSINALYDGLIDLIYPVGSIYISVNNTSPATIFGGTWAKINGRFLVGTGTVTDSIGTSKTFNTYDTGGLFKHNHITSIGMDNSGILYTALDSSSLPYYGSTILQNIKRGIFTGAQIVDNQPARIGLTSLEDGIPPYYAVNMWERTA